jgi:hypothetical protein
LKAMTRRESSEKPFINQFSSVNSRRLVGVLLELHRENHEG